MDIGILKAWYEGLDDVGSYARRCVMYKADGLQGARILDVNCRNGKGAYGLSELAGPEGFVLGVDPLPAHIEAAKAGEAKALARSGFAASNMAFAVAYPEDLNTVAGDGAFDAVYLNSSVNLAFDRAAVLAEVARALVPGGRLIALTVCADGPRDAGVVEAARALGNAVQAAPSFDDFAAELEAAGFGDIRIMAREPVDPTAGVLADTCVAAAPSQETVTYSTLALEARKR